MLILIVQRLGVFCFSFSGVTSVLFCFRPFAFIEVAALRSIVLRYAGTFNML